jgi:hypothetical protein
LANNFTPLEASVASKPFVMQTPKYPAKQHERVCDCHEEDARQNWNVHSFSGWVDVGRRSRTQLREVKVFVLWLWRWKVLASSQSSVRSWITTPGALEGLSLHLWNLEMHFCEESSLWLHTWVTESTQRHRAPWVKKCVDSKSCRLWTHVLSFLLMWHLTATSGESMPCVGGGGVCVYVCV